MPGSPLHPRRGMLTPPRYVTGFCGPHTITGASNQRTLVPNSPYIPLTLNFFLQDGDGRPVHCWRLKPHAPECCDGGLLRLHHIPDDYGGGGMGGGCARRGGRGAQELSGMRRQAGHAGIPARWCRRISAEGQKGGLLDQWLVKQLGRGEPSYPCLLHTVLSRSHDSVWAHQPGPHPRSTTILSSLRVADAATPHSSD
jgi:hypothetical protein